MNNDQYPKILFFVPVLILQSRIMYKFKKQMQMYVVLCKTIMCYFYSSSSTATHPSLSAIQLISFNFLFNHRHFSAPLNSRLITIIQNVNIQ